MPAEEGRGQRCQASGVLPPLDPRCLGQNGCSHGRDNHPGQRSLGGGEGPRPVKRQGKEVSGWTPPTGGARAREDRVREKKRFPTPPGPRGTGARALWRFGRPPHRKGRRAHPQTCPGAAVRGCGGLGLSRFRLGRCTRSAHWIVGGLLFSRAARSRASHARVRNRIKDYVVFQTWNGGDAQPETCL